MMLFVNSDQYKENHFRCSSSTLYDICCHGFYRRT